MELLISRLGVHWVMILFCFASGLKEAAEEVLKVYRA
jgi:hypothetical protein